jgi:YVTN family beta-propeller protein
MKTLKSILIVFLFFLGCVVARPVNAARFGRDSATANASPSAVVSDATGAGVYVAEYLPKQVVHVMLADGRVDWKTELPASPSGLVLDAGRGRVYVTLEGSEGLVQALDARTGMKPLSIPVGYFPLAPSLSPDGKLLAVCNRFNNTVSVLDVESQRELGRINVPREPVASAFTPDGRRLIVANHLPAGAAREDTVAAMVSLIDPASRTVVTNLMLPNGSTGLRGVAVSPDGAYAYVTHTLGRYQLPTTQLERGWMNTSAISIVDLAGDRMFGTFLLDDVDLGAANPWGVACTPDGKTLCVAHAGTHEVSVIDRMALHERFARVAKGEKVGVSQSLADIPNDLSFLVGIRRRVALSGNGPRGLCLANGQAVTGLYYSDELAVIPLGEGTAKTMALGPRTALSTERTGERYFNDARFCFQNWQSCASCHPDGRADGLNWDLLNDGIGNPKNTKNMVLSIQTPPSMSLGIREDAQKAVRSGLKFIQFAVRPEEDALAIDAYLKKLKPVLSPYLVKGKLSQAAQRGQKVFKQAGCIGCHSGSWYTDLGCYDVGTGEGMDKDKPFDTPSLVECWRTAPYFYDGRATTLKEAFLKFNPDDKHGRTSKLSPRELDDLVDYVLSL